MGEEHRFTREQILGIFGVSEEELAAVDNGWTEAHEQARAYEREFAAGLRVRADYLAQKLSDHYVRAGGGERVSFEAFDREAADLAAPYRKPPAE